MVKTLMSAAFVLAGLSFFDAMAAKAEAVLVTVEVDPQSTGAEVGDKVLVTVGDGSRGMPGVTGVLKMITVGKRTFLGVQVTVSSPRYIVDPAKDKAHAALLTGAGSGMRATGGISASKPYQSWVKI